MIVCWLQKRSKTRMEVGSTLIAEGFYMFNRDKWDLWELFFLELKLPDNSIDFCLHFF